MRFSKGLASVVAVSLLACGGRASAPPPTAAKEPSGAGAVVPAATPAADLSPIPAPEGLKVIVSVKDAEALLRNVRDLAGPAFPTLKTISVDAGAQAFLGAALSDVVDLTKPIDVGFLDAFDTSVVSLALASIDDARQNLAENYDLVPREPPEAGVLTLAPRSKKGEAPRVRCEIRPAARGPAYRLVCATGAANNLRALAPYLTRTVAREDAPDDIRVRVFPAAFLALRPPSNPAKAVVERALTDFIADTGSLSLDATLAGDSIGARAEAAFGSSHSPLARLILAERAREKAAAGPLLAPPRRLSRRRLRERGGRGGSGADEDLAARFDHDVAPGARSAGRGDRAGHGGDSRLRPLHGRAAGHRVRLRSRGRRLRRSRARRSSTRVERSALHGWFLAGVEEPSARWVDGLRALGAVKRFPWKMPRTQCDEPVTVTVVESHAVDSKLPAGTAAFVWEESVPVKCQPAKAAKAANAANAANAKRGDPSKNAFHLYVVPDGTRTWIAISRRE